MTIVLLIAVLTILSVISIFSGPALSLTDALSALLSGVLPWNLLSPALFELRIVHVLLAASVGFALSVGGRSLQLFLRNPLADPHVVGLSAGSTTAVLLFVLVFPQFAELYFWDVVPSIWLAAFAGATLAVLVFQLVFAGVSRRWGVASIALVGLLINAACAAGLMLIFARMSPSMLSLVQVWTLGAIQPYSVASAGLLLPLLLFSAVSLIRCDASLQVLSFGSEFAAAHGVNSQQLRRSILVALTILCAAAVCAAGSIGFVGLMVPHLTRRLFFSDAYASVRPWLNGILGAIILVFADLLSRISTTPMELPVGVYTALLSTPFLMFVLLRRGVGV
ncbi:MAG: transporter permease [Pseudomonadota bacterium]